MRFGWRERYESRGSRTVLRGAGVKFPGLLTLKGNSYRVKINNNMKVVTVVTHDERYFKVLKKSCEKHNCDLVVLGWNKPYTGHFMKDQLVYNFLCNENCNNNEIVMFVDGFDSVIVNDSDVILNKFKRLNQPLLISTDIQIHPFKNIFAYYYYWKIYPKCKDVYLNSGMYMGYVYALKNLLTCVLELEKQCNHNSNQRAWIQLFYENPSLFFFDTTGYIFYNHITYFSVSNDTPILKENKIIVPKFDSYPCVLSAPGNTNIRHILRQLGYTNVPSSTKKKCVYLKKFMYYWKLFIPEAVLLAILFCYLSLTFGKIIFFVFNRIQE